MTTGTPRPLSGLEQEQFLNVLTREEAVAAFRRALDPRPLGREEVALDELAGRVLAEDVAAPVDTPPFDRSVVDGFAVCSADLQAASPAAPVRLGLNTELIACGTDPRLTVRPGTATPIATGGPVPRGADAIVMIEHTEYLAGEVLLVRSAAAPGQNIAFAGSDVARGQTLLHRGAAIGAREIGMLAAAGLARARVWRKPRVAVISTGDELVPPGEALRPAAIYDSNGPVIAAAVEENGCTAVRSGAVPDDEQKLAHAIRSAYESCDAVILSGGTSKGAGDLTYRLVADLGRPGIVAHGVALKPGKPLCLAVCDGKPVVVLPGFPTSAMFTFHDIVAPVLRILAGLPARQESDVGARVPIRISSELGRTEFVMAALARSEKGLVAHPVGKGSGSVTAFSQADGFFAVDALSDGLAADTTVTVRLFTPHLRIPDLVIIGSHCIGLDAVVGLLADRGLVARILATGSLAGLGALRRKECDIAPIHLLEPLSGEYNRSFLAADMRLVSGWRRMQGIVFRPGDRRFEKKAVKDAIAAALADPDCIMVNRNSGSGTRTLIEGLLNGQRPPGYWNQPRSHNAVAASVSQSRADWGVAIRPVADGLGLGFTPLTEEHYDFAVSRRPRNPDGLAAFEAVLRELAVHVRRIGFEPAG